VGLGQGRVGMWTHSTRPHGTRSCLGPSVGPPTLPPQHHPTRCPLRPHPTGTFLPLQDPPLRLQMGSEVVIRLRRFQHQRRLPHQRRLQLRLQLRLLPLLLTSEMTMLDEPPRDKGGGASRHHGVSLAPPHLITFVAFSRRGIANTARTARRTMQVVGGGRVRILVRMNMPATVSCSACSDRETPYLCQPGGGTPSSTRQRPTWHSPTTMRRAPRAVAGCTRCWGS